MRVKYLCIVGVLSPEPSEAKDTKECVKALCLRHGPKSHTALSFLLDCGNGEAFDIFQPCPSFQDLQDKAKGKLELIDTRVFNTPHWDYSVGMYVIGNFYSKAQVLEVLSG